MRQSTYGFNVTLTTGFDMTTTTSLRVRINKPSGAFLSRSLSLGNIITAATGVVSVPILAGDLDELGANEIQLIDDTTGRVLKTDIGSIYVEPNLDSASPPGRITALTLLKAQCAASTYPVLSNEELDVILDQQGTYTIWLPSTPYLYGALVVPTVGNGHLYRCIVAGTSGTTEPFWPLYSTSDDRVGLTRPYYRGFGTVYLSQVGDNAIEWEEAGPVHEMYDVRLATHNAWKLKASKVSARYDGSIDGNQYSRSQIFEHCLEMAQRYAPTSVY